MDIQQITITQLSFPFGKLSKLDGKYDVNDTLTLKYNKFTINNYKVNIKVVGKYCQANFGCKTIGLNTIERVINFLEEKDIKIIVKRLVKKTNSDARYLKSKVIDESKDFFITSTKKVYAKADYEIREVELTEGNLKFADRWGYKVVKSKASYIFMGDTRLCATDTTSKKNFLNRCKYLREILTETNKFLKQQ